MKEQREVAKLFTARRQPFPEEVISTLSDPLMRAKMAYHRTPAAGDELVYDALGVRGHVSRHRAANVEPEGRRFRSIGVVIGDAEGFTGSLRGESARLAPFNEEFCRIVHELRRPAMLNRCYLGFFEVDGLHVHDLSPLSCRELIPLAP